MKKHRSSLLSHKTCDLTLVLRNLTQVLIHIWHHGITRHSSSNFHEISYLLFHQFFLIPLTSNHLQLVCSFIESTECSSSLLNYLNDLKNFDSIFKSAISHQDKEQTSRVWSVKEEHCVLFFWMDNTTFRITLCLLDH